MSINFGYDPTYKPLTYAPITPPTYSSYTAPTFAPTTLSSSFRPAPIADSSQKVRVTFNHSGYQQSFPRPTYTPPVVSTPVQRPVLAEPVAREPVREAVREVNFETGELKSVKEGEFIGCFHCFSPVTYDTKAKKPLCG